MPNKLYHADKSSLLCSMWAGNKSILSRGQTMTSKWWMPFRHSAVLCSRGGVDLSQSRIYTAVWCIQDIVSLDSYPCNAAFKNLAALWFAGK